MMIVISDNNIILKDKKDVILTHLYIKTRQLLVHDPEKENISEGVRELLFYIYDMGGIDSIQDFKTLAKQCRANTPIKSEDSVRNTISMCVRLGIIENIGKYQKKISKEWLPEKVDEIIGLDYKIVNSAIQEATAI